jgi:hypothetical protein
MRSYGTTEARTLDRNARMLRPQDLKSMLDRIESLAKSGNREAAKRLLDELQAMLEGLRGRQARPDQPGEMGEMLDELGRMIQEQQRLRDRTFREGRDSRADRRKRHSGTAFERERHAMDELKQNRKEPAPAAPAHARSPEAAARAQRQTEEEAARARKRATP